MDGVDAPPPPPDFALSPQDPGGPPSAIDPGPLNDPLVEPAPVAMPPPRPDDVYLHHFSFNQDQSRGRFSSFTFVSEGSVWKSTFTIYRAVLRVCFCLLPMPFFINTHSSVQGGACALKNSEIEKYRMYTRHSSCWVVNAE